MVVSKTRCGLCLEIPDVEVSKTYLKYFLSTYDHLLGSESLVDADHDPGQVKHEEHEHCHDQNQGEVQILSLLRPSEFGSWGSFGNISYLAMK